MTFIVVGVDGGGSKTRVIVADEAGTQLGEVVGPGSAVRPGEAERSADVIAAAVRDALASCEMTHVVPKVLCVGVAGAGVEVAELRGQRRGAGENQRGGREAPRDS